MALHESGEMYLETIQVLSEKQDYVRSIDICNFMGFSKPSISRAVKNLKEEGFIDVDNNGFITLTDAGQDIADKIYGRHKVLSEFLVSLGVDSETADRDACRIEHVISDETMNAIKKSM